jgi:hypothetical protein
MLTYRKKNGFYKSHYTASIAVQLTSQENTFIIPEVYPTSAPHKHSILVMFITTAGRRSGKRALAVTIVIFLHLLLIRTSLALNHEKAHRVRTHLYHHIDAIRPQCIFCDRHWLYRQIHKFLVNWAPLFILKRTLLWTRPRLHICTDHGKRAPVLISFPTCELVLQYHTHMLPIDMTIYMLIVIQFAAWKPITNIFRKVQLVSILYMESHICEKNKLARSVFLLNADNHVEWIARVFETYWFPNNIFLCSRARACNMAKKVPWQIGRQTHIYITGFRPS